MPMIHIEFDDTKVQDQSIVELSENLKRIVSECTGIEDVFVYANSARIKIAVAPIEAFIRMSSSKVPNLDELFEKIRSSLSEWRKESGFIHPANLTLIPVEWRFAVNI